MPEKKHILSEIISHLESGRELTGTGGMSAQAREIANQKIAKSAAEVPAAVWQNMKSRLDTDHKVRIQSGNIRNTLRRFMEVLFQPWALAPAFLCVLLVFSVIFYQRTQSPEFISLSEHFEAPAGKMYRGLAPQTLLKDDSLQVRVEEMADFSISRRGQTRYFSLRAGTLRFSHTRSGESDKFFVLLPGGMIEPVGTVFTAGISNSLVNSVRVESGMVILYTHTGSGSLKIESLGPGDEKQFPVSKLILSQDVSAPPSLQLEVQRYLDLAPQPPQSAKVNKKKIYPPAKPVRFYLDNGDQITGVPEKLEKGVYHIRTTMGIIKVPEEKIIKKEKTEGSKD